MQKNKYKYVSVAAMLAVMLLLGLYMWMTYRSAVRDISEQAGNQLPWAMFYESYHRADIVSKGDTLSLPELRGDLSLVSSVEGMNDVLSRRYHSEVSLDTIALFVDSLLSVVNLDRNFTVMEVDHQGKILRQNNDLLTPTSLKTQVFSTRRDQSRGIQLALNDPYPVLAKRLSPLFLASAIILILFGAILIRLLRYLDEQKMMADLRNDFSYAMVHDMKSPLSSIIMGARFLHSGKVDDKPEIKEKYFTIIESEADHLLALVNKLLTISKLENKKLILNKQTVNLEQVIDDIIEKAKAKTEKNIDFTVDLLTKHVWADEQYLAEAISNLIDNAIKYSKDEIKISITSHSTDKYVLLKVLDNGIGISKEDQLIIFDKFGRAAVHEHNRKGGVEDDASLAYIEKTGLEDIIGGYEVVTATNGKEGLQAWQETKPDVIISDIDMPVMNGFEMVERIRETDGNVIIIFTSALTSPNDVKAGYRLGINNYVKKPFVPEELDAHIQALMKMRGGAKTQKEISHYKLGKYTLDAEHATLRNDETGQAQTITLREAQILQLLAENKNNVVRREAILSRFWNTEDDYFASRSLDVFVNKLRKLLADEPKITLKTVRGIGLQLLSD